jgi:cellulose synthase/poly-beta-1,6-N-acetylglucosamine synthase-like glycosyltransferase
MFPNPMIVIHALLSYVPRAHRYQVLRPESVALFIPVYNEESEIGETLQAIFSQTRLPQVILLSENGSTDKTRQVIDQFLVDHGIRLSGTDQIQGVRIDEYLAPNTLIVIVRHEKKTSKACSINFAKGLLREVDRVLSIDSDTKLTPKVIEIMMDSFYELGGGTKGHPYTLYEECMVGGLCRSRKQQKTGLIGELIHRARCANHDVGQHLVRVGQNMTAGFTVSGCGYCVASKDFGTRERTLTEDLDFTWTMETRPQTSITLTLDDLRGMGFVVRRSDNREMPLHRFLSEAGQNEISLVSTNHVRYEQQALLLPVTPGTIGGLYRQVDRWTRGFQQNLVLHNKDLFRNKKLAFVALGFELTGILGALWMLAVPVLLLCYFLTGWGVSLLAAGLVVASELLLQEGLIFLGALSRQRTFGQRRIGVTCVAAFDALATIVPAYFYRWLLAPVFLRNVIRTIADHIGGGNSWNNSWVRPTDDVRKLEQSKAAVPATASAESVPSDAKPSSSDAAPSVSPLPSE